MCDSLNNEVTNPRALNTFLDGPAELGLIKNKTLLSDVIEKEKGYQNAENTSENESNNPRVGGTSRICGWGCAAGTLEPLTYTRARSAEFCYPILD